MVDFQLTEEDLEVRELAHRFAEKEIRPIVAETEWLPDPSARIRWDVVEKGSKLGFRTMTVPREFGGLGASLLTVVLTLEELAWGDLGAAILFEQTLKTARRIARLGSTAQKERFFGEFLKDDRYLLAGAVTEPAHGSDKILAPGKVRLDTTAKPDGTGWILNGTKHFITNGSEARLYLVTATDLSPPNWGGWTILMVPREARGLVVSRIHEKVSQRLSNNAEISFRDCWVSQESELGTPATRTAEGAHFWLESNVEAASMMLGTARAAFESALDFARDRIQGGNRIIEDQAIGMTLAEMVALIESARTLVLRAVWEAEQSKPNFSFGPMVKYHSAEVAFKVCTKAVEVFGGPGIMMELPVQKYLRDSLSAFHFDGTQQVALIRIMNSLMVE